MLPLMMVLVILVVEKEIQNPLSIAMMIVILLVDGTAHARIEAYNKQLLMTDKPADSQ